MTQTTHRPNILFIMDDQHRFDYLGSMGATFVNTPNLDRLAERGVRFTHCTTNSPLCAPARIGLATGYQPFRLGALDNNCFLPRTVPTYYQHLRDHGYRVGCIGKLDLAKPDNYNGRYGDRPSVYSHGFTHPEECEGKMHAGRSATPLGPYGHFLQDQGLLQAFYEDYTQRAAKGWIKDASHDSVLPTDAFEDAYIGRRSAEWIDKIAADYPWHLFVSFVGPHDPFDPPTEYADRYRAAEMPAAIQDSMIGKPDWVHKRVVPMEPDEVAVTRRQYCAAIELIDDQVGLMLAALERRGMAENTVIVFASDHGEMLGDHGIYQKRVAYESSLRVPLLVAGPGINSGVVSEALVELIDLNPTISELAGLPAQPNLDAASIGPLLRGDTDQHRTETISTINHFHCIRTRQHKLIQNTNGIVELYDLDRDPDELNNVAESQPAIVKSLRERLNERLLEGKGLR